MTNDRIAIMCNGVVPDANIPSGAQGLRARGLQLGLQAHGFDVDIVSTANAVHSQMTRWDQSHVRIPSYWRLLHQANCVSVLNRDYGTVVMPNWAVLPDFRPAKQMRLIYDFFSATLVEHSFMTDAETLQKRREQKLELCKLASGFIANGEGRARYGEAFLAEHGLGDHKVNSVRLAVPKQERTVEENEVFRIFAGGFDQPWTRGVTPDILAQIAVATGAEVYTVGLGRNLHIDGNAAKLSAFACNQLSNGRIFGYPPTRAQEYNRLNTRCHVTLDVFQHNAERELSYSTRAVNALANQCPLITMSFTEIGRLVKETEAGWVLDEFSVEALVALLQEIQADRDELARRAANTAVLWKGYGNPVKEAEGLVEILKSI